MARQRSKSGVYDKLGKSLKTHRNDETEYGMQYIDLPGGISNGIAKLIEGKLGKYKSGSNQGEQFAYLAGVVIEPKRAANIVQVFKDGGVKTISAEEIEVEGQRTGLTLPLCETKRSFDDNVSDMLNELRKVGGDDCVSGINTEEDLENLLKTLAESEIFFRFSTSASTPTEEYPEQRIWENWNGVKGLEDYVPNDEGDEVVDATGDTEPDEPDEPDETDEADTSEDLMNVAEAADADDDDAIATITAAAEEAGINHEEYATWVETAKAIGLGTPGENDDGDNDGDFEPIKGKVYLCKLPRTRKSTDVEVTALFPGKQTCNLKRLDDGKTFKSQPWDSLEELEEE